MNSLELKDTEKSLEVISTIIDKAKKAQAKFQEGTSQYTLQKNRINALKIAHTLVNKELGNHDFICFEKEDLEKAVAPIKSLISKSEKAKTKLKQETWQYKMLESNIKALYIALPLILKEMEK